MVPTLERLVLATQVRAFIPDMFPSLASSVQHIHLHRLRQRLHRHRLLIYICLDRVADFIFAYSVLAKLEYDFVPDVHVVLEKLGPHLVLDGSDNIESGINTILQRLPRRVSSFSTCTTCPRHHVQLPRHRHLNRTLTPASPFTATSTNIAAPTTLGYLDIGTRDIILHEHSLSSSIVHDATPSTMLPLRLLGLSTH
jgi:hypothetical protein